MFRSWSWTIEWREIRAAASWMKARKPASNLSSWVGDGTELLDLVEKALNVVAVAIESLVHRKRFLSLIVLGILVIAPAH